MKNVLIGLLLILSFSTFARSEKVYVDKGIGYPSGFHTTKIDWCRVDMEACDKKMRSILNNLKKMHYQPLKAECSADDEDTFLKVTFRYID